jgi:UDP-3-O-[3-hydroxymyristoyl] N-acetylglucosamine deacetylase
MLRQRTLATPVTTSGIGLHTGNQVSLRLCPAPPESGVVFRRVDLVPPQDIPARPENVGATTLSTSLDRAGYRVATVEHLLAALAGLGVDNALVEVSAPEVPIMDGSAAPFVALVRSAGVCEQEAPKRFLRIRREVVVEEGDKVAAFLPYDGFKVSITVDFEHCALRAAHASVEIDFSRASFIDEVSAARTFGFMEDLQDLHKRGMALGGSLDNALIIDHNRVLNSGGLRSDDELARHKVLDALGDLSLLGAALIGEFRGHKSGHTLNNAALRALLAQTDAWEWVSGLEAAAAPLAYEIKPGTVT